MVSMNIFCSKKTARYIQIGIEDSSGFSGFIRDYVGGGSYQEFYFIQGKLLEDISFEDFLFESNTLFSGLGTQIESSLDNYFTYENGAYSPRQSLKRRFLNIEETDEVLCVGKPISLIEVGNTSFS